VECEIILDIKFRDVNLLLKKMLPYPGKYSSTKDIYILNLMCPVAGVGEIRNNLVGN